ncbi:MAG: helix-turn-helix transcriptional regulator [Liquorilactobacillus nagelii]|uniref:helix-turn-helix domain-containing protein n=1 Tax=Lactobacillaceae TaxID=33958 RepID=UPI0039EC58D4
MNATIDLKLIKERRKQLKFTYSEMATSLGLKSPDKYYRRENGEYHFKATELPVLSKKLDIPIEKIFELNLRKSHKSKKKVTE